jgi:hypothetical protein
MVVLRFPVRHRRYWRLAHIDEASAYAPDAREHACAVCATRNITHVLLGEQVMVRTADGSGWQIVGPTIGEPGYVRGFICQPCLIQQRRAWRRDAARARQARHRAIVHCASCGQAFAPSRSNSQYCSNARRQRAYRTRLRDRAHTGPRIPLRNEG